MEPLATFGGTITFNPIDIVMLAAIVIGPYALAITAVALLITFITSRLKGKKLSRSSYIKVTLVSFFLSTILIALLFAVLAAP